MRIVGLISRRFLWLVAAMSTIFWPKAFGQASRTRGLDDLTIQEIIGESHAVYPEVAAWAIRKVLATRKMPAKSRVALVTRLYQLGDSVYYPVRLRLITAANTDRREGFLSIAMEEEVDSLSVRMHAVQEMIKHSPTKAREWFSESSASAIPRCGCTDRALPDLSSYYLSAGRVIASFSDAEMDKGLHSTLLHAVLGATDTPARFPGALQLLVDARMNQADREIAVTTLAAALANARVEDRVFREVWPIANRRFPDVLMKLGADGVSPTPLLEAFRTYVVRSLASERCADNVRDDIRHRRNGADQQTAYPPELGVLNRLLLRYGLNAVQGSQIGKFDTVASGGQNLYWSNPQTKQFDRRLREVYHGREVLTDQAGPARAAMITRAEALINDLMDWAPAKDERTFDFVAQKGHILSKLLTAVPRDSGLRDSLLNELLKTVGLADSSPEVRVLWLWHVRAAFVVQRGGAEDGPARLVEDLARHRDPNVRFFHRVLDLTQ